MTCMMGSQIGSIFALAIQMKAAPFFIIVQWIITPPLALHLAYKHELGVLGLFMAQSLCQISNTIYSYAIIRLQDWEQSVQKAQERMQKDIKERNLLEYTVLSQQDEEQ